LDKLNETRAAAGQPPLKAGIGLHLGEVMYGNIGASDRLDFTVIGRAVNEVARIEAMCRPLDRVLIASDAFSCSCIQRPLVSLGRHALRGVKEPRELFGLA
jgi:adenylate cyclase